MNNLKLISVFLEGISSDPLDKVDPLNKDEALIKKQQEQQMNEAFNSMSIGDFMAAVHEDFYEAVSEYEHDDEMMMKACAGIGVLIRLFMEHKLKEDESL